MELKAYNQSGLGPNILFIIPPYMMGSPPAGAANLLGYLEQNEPDRFDFLDLRLWAPAVPYAPMDHAPTFRYSGAFGENFVIDVPDLPLVLELLRSREEGRRPLVGGQSPLFVRFCRERLKNPEALSLYLSRMERFLRAAFAQLPRLEFAGFTVWPSNYLTTLLAAAILKERQDPPFLVAGGPHISESTSAARLALASGLLDAVAVGEGEETLLELYRDFRGSLAGTAPSAAVDHTPAGSASRVAGTLFHVDGEFTYTERPLLDMAKLPLPSYERMNIDAYFPGRRTINFELSRGCINRCSFCSETTFWKRFRTIDPGQAFDRLRELRARYGFERIMFTDSLVNGRRENLIRFAELIVRSDLSFEWSAYMRADIDPDLADLLHRSGLRHAFIGIESMDDRTLGLMKKSRTREDNLASVRSLLSRGVVVELGIIPGFPGDTRDRFMETVTLIEELMHEYPGMVSPSLAPFTLTPGQEIFHDPGAFGLSLTGWDPEYLEIAPGYLSITKDIPCTAEGDNQGIERTGQMARLENAAKNGRELAARLSHGHLRSAGQASVWQTGLTASQLSLSRVANGWYLGLRQSENGSIYGAILSDPELREFGDLRLRGVAEYGKIVGQDHLPPDLFREFFERIEEKHFVPPRTIPHLVDFCEIREKKDHMIIRLSPHSVARLISSDGEERLLAAVITSRVISFIPPELTQVIERIRDGRYTIGEIEDHIERKTEFGIARWRSILEELTGTGFFILTHPSHTKPELTDPDRS